MLISIVAPQGNVLFKNTIGCTEWYLGADEDLLVRGIRKKLLTLPPHTKVFPGHGSPTTIDKEARTNPYLQPSIN